jgi:hypothetical protein
MNIIEKIKQWVLSLFRKSNTDYTEDYTDNEVIIEKIKQRFLNIYTVKEDWPDYSDKVQYKIVIKRESKDFAEHFPRYKALNNEDKYSIEVLYINGNFIGGWQGDGISEYLTEGVWIAYVKDNEVTDIRTYFVF